MKTSNPEVKRLAKLAFKGYAGRTYRLEVRASAYFDATKSGGSWDTIKAVNLATGEVRESSNFGNPFSGIACGEVVIPDGIAIVSHSYFCGKDTGLCVYVNPSSATPALTDGSEVA